jgi:hypothetical protein
MSFGPLFIQPTNSLAIWLGGKLLQEIQEIPFEIGMLGQYGPDIYDPQGTRVLRVLLGRVFSALEMGCIKYAGFKEDRAGDGIGVDIGVDLGEKTERLREEKVAETNL